MKWLPETPKIASISEAIDTYGSYSEGEPEEPTVAITADIEKVRILSLDIYVCFLLGRGGRVYKFLWTS